MESISQLLTGTLSALQDVLQQTIEVEEKKLDGKQLTSLVEIAKDMQQHHIFLESNMKKEELQKDDIQYVRQKMREHNG